jgi:hypothetical protein
MPGSLSNSKGMVIRRSAILWDFRDGFEEELLALFVAIEVSNYRQGLGPCLTLGKKKRKLKRL